MVDLKKLTGRAKDLVEKRGGPEGLKRDAAELMGALSEKAKSAAERLREPSERKDTQAPEREAEQAKEEAEPERTGVERPAEPSREPPSGL